MILLTLVFVLHSNVLLIEHWNWKFQLNLFKMFDFSNLKSYQIYSQEVKTNLFVLLRFWNCFYKIKIKWLCNKEFSKLRRKKYELIPLLSAERLSVAYSILRRIFFLKLQNCRRQFQSQKFSAKKINKQQHVWYQMTLNWKKKHFNRTIFFF
jgi:hypothetical protein